MKKLTELAGTYGIRLDEHMLWQFQQYEDALIAWNKKMNLTSILDHDGIMIKHFLDSLLLLDALQIDESSSMLDVGSGAGFPGVPIKIARPDIQLHLLDSLAKRIQFLQALQADIRTEYKCSKGRAEELGNDPVFREKFDYVTARAVAPLKVLTELCLPFVRVGGHFVALKGKNIDEEIGPASDVITQCGGAIMLRKSYMLPNSDERTIVVFKKESQTPTNYPRRYAKITKEK